ncbi:EAL domain-containing protein [Thiomicrorhabdus aquaedulcis]|uniref:EAL domain-containing protein n=1 Tax=Thiomicrorhabdus aquaedulcis TaxID=2211106 RepID=UPI0015625C6E|nr:EAL domain-containing protein [Thiomicrorhabdus aquaedulcis]
MSERLNNQPDPSHNTLTEQERSSLREKALQALSNGDLQLQGITQIQQATLDSVFEELRIYQAELEIQNQTLRLAQTQLQLSQTLYQMLFESLPMAALVLNSMGVIVQVNNEAMRLLVLSQRRHLVNHSIYRYIAQEGASWLAHRLTQGHTHTISEQQMEVYTAQGTQLVAAHLVRLPIDSMQAQSEHKFIILLADLSLEVAKQEQWQLFESIINNSPTLIYAFDREGQCILANNKMVEQMGLSDTSEIIGKNRVDIINSQDANVHFENDGLVFSTGHSIGFEEGFLHQEHQRYYLSNKFPLKNLNNEIYAVAGISLDITEQRMSEIRLKIALQVFSQGQEGILICDHNQQILSVNHAFEAITGFSEIEMIGKNPRILASGKHPLSFYQSLWQSLLSDGKWSGEIWNRRKSGDVYPQFLTISLVYDSFGQVTHYLGVFSDITARKAAEEEIQYLAFYDSLTGTANRFLLRERVEQKIREADRNELEFAILYIDLDHFKEINDVYGHDAGDALLKKVTSRILDQIRKQDTLSRIGGDEFVLMLDEINSTQALYTAQKIVSLLVAPYFIDGLEMNISASIGLAIYPEHAQDFDSLLKYSDVAMYQSKTNGRNSCTVFENWMIKTSQEFITIDVALRNAILAQQLQLVFQPQISFVTQQVEGFEALLRWTHPDLGEVSPAIFIPIAEKSDLIVEISDWVIQKSLDTLSHLQSEGFIAPCISVNISAREFIHPNFVGRIKRHLERYPTLKPACLELELTERVAIHEPEKVRNIFEQLNAMGVLLALDDFGTDYSSLNTLKNLPLQRLKIDMSFVKGVIDHHQDASVCHAIIAMAKALKLNTVVEGVETLEQANFFKQAGANTAQGYWFAKPMHIQALKNWLQARNQ